MATWPVTLPQEPLIDQYAEVLPDTIIRSEPDVGPSKVRQRISKGVRNTPCKFIMSKAQVAIFDTFYVTTLYNGSLAFDFTNPRTGSTDSYRFASVPRYVPASTDADWIVECQLEILP